METLVIIFGVVIILLLIGVAISIFIIYKHSKKQQNLLQNNVKNNDDNSSLESEKLQDQKIENMQTHISNSLLKNLDETKDNLSQKLSTIQFDLQKHNDSLISNLVKTQNEKLSNIEENNKKLFERFEKQINEKIEADNLSAKNLREENLKIREDELQKRIETVEEIRKKIDTNFKEELAPKIDGKFNEIKENFNNIQTQVGSLQSLSNEIKDIHKIFFSDFKTRGIAGETSFENLISDVLPTDEYEKQYKIEDTKIVDFAIKIMPNNDSRKMIYLPVDSKFPSDAYLKYSKSKEDAINAIDLAKAEDEFIRNLTLKAKSIQEKYIVKNKTTEIALMFIPSEAIFTEVIKLRQGNFISDIRSKYKVEIISPVIANYVIYLIKSWHNKFEFVQGSKKYIDFISKFKKRYEMFNKHSDAVLRSAKTFADKVENLVKANKSIFEVIATFEARNKKVMTEIFEETLVDGSAHENDMFLESQPTAAELIELTSEDIEK